VHRNGTTKEHKEIVESMIIGKTDKACRKTQRKTLAKIILHSAQIGAGSR
jgi:hypothetical protein